MENNCLFCSIFQGKTKARVIHKDENTIAILDSIPRFAKGQCVIIHRRHVKQFYELDDNEIAELFITVKKVAKKLQAIFNPDFVCIFSRGQTVDHAHIIIYPSSPYGTLDGALKTIDTARQLTLNTLDQDIMDGIAKAIQEA